MANDIFSGGTGSVTLNTTKDKKQPSWANFGKKGQANLKRSHEEEIINALKTRYGLSDSQIELMKPLLDSFYQGNLTSADIETYANELMAAQQQLDYNSESAVANRMRAAGLNPDLTGLSEGNGEIPGAGNIVSAAENKSASSEGACKQKANQITSTLMQAVTLGLNAYGIVQGQLAGSIASGAAAAGEDLLNLSGNAEGFVDIKSELGKMLNSRIFRNKSERRAYITEVTRRANAFDIATQRLNRKAAHNEAKLNNRIAEFKGSENYITNALQILEKKQTIDLLAAKYDNEIAERNAQFLVDHPEYNEAKLQAKLNEANTAKASAEARKSESEADVAEKTESAQIRKAGAEARSAEANADITEDNKDVQKLRNENEKTKLAFEKAVNTVITEYVEEDLNTWDDWEKRKGFANKRAKFKQARRYKERAEGRRHNISANVPGVGSVSTNL